MKKTRLVIARHGNTFSPGDIVTRVGKTDLPLVASGLEQGRLMGRYLKREGLVPDALFTSSLKRTRQTAEQAQTEMGTALPLRPLTIFDEIDYGPDENRPEEEVIARLGAAALQAWDRDGVVPDGWKVDPASIIENWMGFAAQVAQDYAEKTVLVVTSNGIARFAPYLTGDFQAFISSHSIKISTGALCVFEYAGVWNCTAWNLKPKDLLAAG
jgi:2,3-bisphosphoglycerate-dependent phosphoglycerate mutase